MHVPPCTITYDAAARRLDVVLEGNLTMPTRTPIKEALLAAVTEHGPALVRIDCQRVPYIDNAGLGALVSVARTASRGGGRVVLAGLNEDLQTLFELTKLDTLFAIEPPLSSVPVIPDHTPNTAQRTDR